MSEPSREHIEAVARSVSPGAYEEWPPEFVSMKQAISVHRRQLVRDLTSLLTSTDPAVLDAMQDALVRAGRLRESLTVAWDSDEPDMSGQPQRARAGVFRSRETADRAAAFYRTRGKAAAVETRYVTEWQEAQP